AGADGTGRRGANCCYPPGGVRLRGGEADGRGAAGEAKRAARAGVEAARRGA
ncbi:unnamed protein product, partial [Effrenium voratum]